MSWELTGNASINPNTNFLGTTDAQPLIIKTNDTEAVRVTADGKVGIGDSNPEFQLQVTAPNQLGIAVKGPFRSVGAGIQLQTVANDPLDQGRGWELLATGTDASQGIDKFNIRDLVLGTDVITIDGDNHDNVGINIQQPQAKLHVTSGGDFNSPQMQIDQTTRNDSARLRFESSRDDPDGVARGHWDIAATPDVMHFIWESRNIMTLHRENTATVGVLEITGGGDVAEPFVVENHTEVEPGMVMVIDKNAPGQLRISDVAYDRNVAGIVSGAGGLKPGLKLQQELLSERNVHVALAGRVYCKVEATSSPIEPGDLLTTSHIPGHAMRAVDEQCSRGAILGKAMNSLQEGRGLVLVLVSLQ